MTDYMDWLHQDPAAVRALQSIEGGHRTGWALQHLEGLNTALHAVSPLEWPADAAKLLAAVRDLFAQRGWSPPVQRRALRCWRRLLAADPRLAAVHRAFPLRLRTTPLGQAV